MSNVLHQKTNKDSHEKNREEEEHIAAAKKRKEEEKQQEESRKTLLDKHNEILQQNIEDERPIVEKLRDEENKLLESVTNTGRRFIR